MITTALILAAGMGSRLHPIFNNKPKGLYPIAGIPLIERSIAALLHHNFKNIVVVTGHLAKHYQALESKYPQVQTVHNPDYASSGSMHSLYCARNQIDADYLLIEADLIYERRAIQTLLECPHPQVVLMSGFTQAGDEFYIEGNETYITNYSKNKDELNNILGEMVGITKISLEFHNEMNRHLATLDPPTSSMEYTDLLLEVARDNPLRHWMVEDLLWGEVDYADHAKRVKEIVYPAILAKDGT